MDPAISFATSYDKEFRKLTSGYSHNEIPLFRALHQSLINLSSTFDVEEYHGGAHQVNFKGNGTYARTMARCELSDLMVISFSSITKEARLTYLQAKSERATLASVCGRRFSANLEQWFLLNQRPPIVGVGSFDPPNDLLASALLSSVGSFAFFYKDTTGNFQTYYASAAYLTPSGKYSQRYGKLQAIGPCLVCNSKPNMECMAACGNVPFAESLFRLEIGTPIECSIPQAASTRTWLSSKLRRKIRDAQQADAPSGLAQELIELLDPEGDSEGNGSLGAKSLIIIKSNAEPNNSLQRTRLTARH